MRVRAALALATTAFAPMTISTPTGRRWVPASVRASRLVIVRLLLACGVTALSALAVATPVHAAPADDEPQSIIDGTPVGETTMPSDLIALVRSGNETCSGTLVAQQWVLTAASCINGNGYRPNHEAYSWDSVTVGAHDDRAVTYTDQQHGIALLKLDRPVARTNFLPLAQADLLLGANTTVYGRGQTCDDCAVPVGPLRSAPARVTGDNYISPFGGGKYYENEAQKVRSYDVGGPQLSGLTLSAVVVSTNNYWSISSMGIASERSWIERTIAPFRLPSNPCTLIRCGAHVS